MNEYPTYLVGEIVYYIRGRHDVKHECVIRKVVNEPRGKAWGTYIISSTTDDGYFKNSRLYTVDGVMYPGNQCASTYLEKIRLMKPIKSVDRHRMI